MFRTLGDAAVNTYSYCFFSSAAVDAAAGVGVGALPERDRATTFSTCATIPLAWRSDARTRPPASSERTCAREAIECAKKEKRRAFARHALATHTSLNNGPGGARAFA